MERPLRANYTKCSKKNPATCRLHGHQYKKFQTAMRSYQDQERLAEEQKIVADLQNDIQKNFKLKKLSDGTYEASVYRVGVPQPPVERKVEKDSYVSADSFAPNGRQGRMSAVFAAPVLGVVGRWADDMTNRAVDQQVRELRVNPDEVYVYSVHAWERASSSFGNKPEEQRMKEYWSTGVTLSEWMREANKGHILDPGEWELLLPEKSIRKATLPSINRVMESQFAYTFRNDELESWLKSNRKGLEMMAEREAAKTV